MTQSMTDSSFNKCAVRTSLLGSEFPEEVFQEIREILLDRCGIDLNMYKDRCIKRRIASRVRVQGVTSEDYAALLRRDSAELGALVEALTIHVSQFFRNPSTFAALESIYLPSLIEGARQDGREKLCLWSVGCSSGEEPYSLALLLAELPLQDIEVTVLASDISSSILRQAREGVYDLQRMTDVPERVRDKYFLPAAGGYQLVESIRHRVEFRQQDILRDEVYPQADLILCRNVLIYFSRREQEKILHRFATALPSSGVLVLGKAETLLGDTRELFWAVDPTERIYLKKDSGFSVKQTAGGHAGKGQT